VAYPLDPVQVNNKIYAYLSSGCCPLLSLCHGTKVSATNGSTS